MKGPDGFVQAYNAQVAVDALQLDTGGHRTSLGRNLH